MYRYFGKGISAVSLAIFCIVFPSSAAEKVSSDESKPNVPNSLIADQQEQPPEGRARRRWFCGLFQDCQKTSDRGDDEEYCAIAPNGTTIDIWREVPMFVFFDHDGTVRQINLHRRGATDNPIWSYDIAPKANNIDTLYVIHNAEDSLQTLQTETHDWSMVIYVDETIPKLESREIYYYEILTEQDIEDENDGYARRMQLRLLPNNIRTRIELDLEDIQQNNLDGKESHSEAIFDYFYMDFEVIAQAEFPDFFAFPRNGFLLDSVYQIFSLSPLNQEHFIQDTIEYCRGDSQEEN